ncbi:hypothetical protein [Microbacterium sp. C7(2022)]|uniref:hypothetical protein n=1 Tax=Microbacterium sp. C7(2022) TaxID=2992759 RepID=UPI00237A91CA|nr:hypothetical protein [Microbacterium sp. C7(2022)]MDE0546786.1 hypothetical protein [Microbacterium sp. C7(2022)]
MSIASAALASIALLGCAPEPEPTPTPTALFSSDEEAFAAAEATYRAYVDALNEVDLSDPETFEPVFDLSTGDLNAANRETFSEMHANELIVTGDTEIVLLQPSGTQPDDFPSTVWLDACIDVSEIDVRQQDGSSVVSPERTDIQAMRISVAQSGPRGVAELAGRDDGASCSE